MLIIIIVMMFMMINFLSRLSKRYSLSLVYIHHVMKEIKSTCFNKKICKYRSIDLSIKNCLSHALEIGLLHGTVHESQS